MLKPGPATESSEQPATQGWFQTTFRALRHRNYRLYFFGQIVSLTGTWIQMAALSWLAYALTNESKWPAWISAAQVVPMLVLGIWGGSLADRFSRRRLIFCSQVIMLSQALMLAILVVFDWISPGLLLALSLFLGVINAVDTPARLAFVIDMVGREDLLNAVALNSLVFNLARAIGPAIGGQLLIWFGPAGCFLVNGLTFLAVLIALVLMQLPVKIPRSDTRNSGSLWAAFSHLSRNPALILLLVLAGAMALFGWPVLSLLPALADKQMHNGEIGYPLMLSGIGTGALVGAVLVAWLGNPARRGVFLATGIMVGVLSLLALAISTILWVGVVSCAVSGCGLILFFATGQAIMQLGADDQNRGTLMGIWLMILAGAQPIGNVIAGTAADAFGVQIVLVVEALGIAITGLSVMMIAVAGGINWHLPVIQVDSARENC